MAPYEITLRQTEQKRATVMTGSYQHDDFDEAIGSHEAAALMGVHHSRPAKLASRGQIRSRVVKGSSTAPKREMRLYSRKSCEKDWSEYERTLTANKGRTRRRPRAYVANRIPVLNFLNKPGRVKIAFHDAIGVYEAAKCLGDVSIGWPPKLVKDGKIKGRKLWASRKTKSRSSDDRTYVISKESCLENYVAAWETSRAGRKRPRIRQVKAAADKSASKPKEYVYVYEEAHQGRVKIGTTRVASATRMRQGQTTNSRKLVLLLQMSGGAELEKKLHRRFAVFRVPDGGSEWFYKTVKIAEFIEKERAKQEAIHDDSDQRS
jgi:hypothetical protein